MKAGTLPSSRLYSWFPEQCLAYNRWSTTPVEKSRPPSGLAHTWQAPDWATHIQNHVALLAPSVGYSRHFPYNVKHKGRHSLQGRHLQGKVEASPPAQLLTHLLNDWGKGLVCWSVCVGERGRSGYNCINPQGLGKVQNVVNILFRILTQRQQKYDTNHNRNVGFPHSSWSLMPGPNWPLKMVTEYLLHARHQRGENLENTTCVGLASCSLKSPGERVDVTNYTQPDCEESKGREPCWRQRRECVCMCEDTH